MGMCSSWNTMHQVMANMAIGVVVGCTNVLGVERAMECKSSMFSVCVGFTISQVTGRAHGWYQR